MITEEEKDPELTKILDDIRATISKLSSGRSASVLLMAMIDIANKEHWSSTRLLAWIIQATALLEHRFNLKIDDEAEGKTLQ